VFRSIESRVAGVPVALLVASQAALAACAFALTPIDVPPEIARRTQLELSGAVWSAQLSRYVVVSDDVSDEGAKHAPLLFTLDEHAHIDATPITIHGVEELNDPESITAGPDGTLFVCTSHSLNKHGHWPRARRRLLQLALEPATHGARVVGELDLSTARGADVGEAPWGPRESLDVEAFAFKEGSLYFGLKAPLAADGSAMILRLENAATTVRSGSLAAGALNVWTRAKLCLPHAGTTVCEGFADLAFLPDGGLLAAANSPKNMPSDGGGALWRVTPGGEAKLVKHFSGLKPEAVALAPDRRRVIVLFDRDGQQPLSTQWPIAP